MSNWSDSPEIRIKKRKINRLMAKQRRVRKNWLDLDVKINNLRRSVRYGT